MKTRVLSVLALSMAVAMASSAAAGQTAAAQPPSAPDVQTLGPQVGTKVPNFSLADQHGRTQTLKSIVGPKGAVLVFFRSADW